MFSKTSSFYSIKYIHGQFLCVDSGALVVTATPIHLSIYLYLSIYLSINLSFYIFVCLSFYFCFVKIRSYNHQLYTELSTLTLVNHHWKTTFRRTKTTLGTISDVRLNGRLLENFNAGFLYEPSSFLNDGF